MSFTSLEFYIFFTVVLGLYMLLPHKLQNILLLIASYFFYAYWNLSFTYLLLLTTIIDYYCALKIAAAGNERARKGFLFVSLTINILILAIFKYGNVFIGGYNSVFMRPGDPSSLIKLHIFFPIGISFYIFQSLAYTIDVYRGYAKPSTSFLDYALYVSFFPQLLAGPIERPRHMLPQIEQARTVSLKNIKVGAHLIFWGLFQKLFVADSCAMIADAILLHPYEHSGGEILVGMYASAFRAFADISGYTDIARGTARCLGFDLAINFHRPYFATNISKFWQRWHISVTSWFRDYLYFPLLVATKGNAYLCSFVTLLCIAVWHSLSVNSILRGVYFGCLIVLYHAVKKVIGRPDDVPSGQERWLGRARNIVSGLITFHFVCVGLLFLLNVKAHEIPAILLRIPRTFELSLFTSNLLLMLRYAGPLLLVQIFQSVRKDELFILKTGFMTRLLFYWVLFMLLYGVSGGVLVRPFIYFHY